MSLRVKLVLWYTAFLALSGAILTATLYIYIAQTIQDEADRFLQEGYADLARLTLENVLDSRRLAEKVKEELDGDRYIPRSYRLHDAQAGRDVLVVRAARLQDFDPAAAPLQAPAAQRTYATLPLGPAGSRVRLLTGPLHPERAPNLVLQVGVLNRWVDRRKEILRTRMILVLTGVTLAAAVGGWVLASRSLKPIDRIVTELGHVESSTLAARLEVGSSGGEVDRLREAINRMLERLHVAFDRLQGFTADAAHELRTPIARLQCQLELAVNKPPSEAGAREALTEALDHVAELHALVDNMLFLARMDAEPRLRGAGSVDVGALLRDIGEPFVLLAEQKGVRLSVECEGEVRTQGDPALLRRLFGNLIDNAVRYTPEGGRVTARLRHEGGCVVSVADTGIGIQPEALPHVFDRFYRADESRSRDAGGAGLGLSIVKRVVELHSGALDIQSAPGQGTTVEVRFPAAPPDA